MSNNNFTQRELLYRIDERQKQLLKEVMDIKKALQGKVDNDSKYQDMVYKFSIIWDKYNSIKGFVWLINGLGVLINLMIAIWQIWFR